MKSTHSYLAIGACAFLLTGCLNLFSPFDHATSDPQLISAARACLDQGNYACALKDYQELSNNSADVANSEEAYTLYNEAHIDMGTFIGAFGTGGNGAGGAVTQIAGTLSNAAQGASAAQANLLTIFHGYQKVANISDPTLRGIVRIVGGVGMVSQILAAMASSPGTLAATDIAIDPTGASGCENSGVQCDNAALPQATNPCHQPNGNVISGTPLPGTFSDANDPLAQAQDSDIALSFGMIYTAIEAANLGLSDLGISSGNTASLLSALNGVGTEAFIVDVGTTDPSSSPCFRQLLLNQGIGS